MSQTTTETMLDLPNPAAKGIPYFTPAQVPASGTASDPQPDGKPIPKLFTPLKLRGLTLQNRIFLSPLCQYSADDGHMTAWHMAHLGGIVSRGTGLAMIEATGVEARGRITPEDTGLWKDSQIEPMQKVVEFAHSQNQKLGIQLAHAGRKASTVAPWINRSYTALEKNGGWPDQVIAPSAIAHSPGLPVPIAMGQKEIQEVKDAFAAAAKRFLKTGGDFIEIHCAHGYLLHQFLSPVSNKRTDNYGGSFENRTRLLLEIVDIVRATIPEDMPLLVRVSGTDALEEIEEDSWKSEDTIRLAPLLAEHGVDLLDVSAGGNDPRQKIASGDAYQASYALDVKRAVGDKLLVTSVGGIRTGPIAQKLLDDGLDAVFAGRWFQRNSGLVWEFAEQLGVQIDVAHQIAWAFGGKGGARF